MTTPPLRTCTTGVNATTPASRPLSLAHLVAVAYRAADSWGAYAAMLLSALLVSLLFLWPILAHMAATLAPLAVL